jgi:hypothetical protein
MFGTPLPETPLLDAVPLWALSVATIVGILLAVEAGYRLGRPRGSRPVHEREALVGGMVAAELGLLAFLLAFTFGMAAERFESRRQVLLDETNAVGTAYLRAAMLQEPQRGEIRRLLREYVNVRLAGVQKSAREEAIRRSNELQVRLWSQATAVAEKDARSVPVGLFVGSLNEVIDLHAKRVNLAARHRIPTTVWFVLFAVSVLSFGAMGYQAGLTGSARSPAIGAIALTFAMVIWLIVDLDRPQRGLLRVSQKPMIELRNMMAAPSPPAGANPSSREPDRR